MIAKEHAAEQARELMLKQISEKEFQAQVIEFAQSIGWTVYHTHNSKHSVAGYPDLHFIHRRGRQNFFAELKKVGGKLRTEQRWWLEALKECGHEVYLWTPRDWDHIELRLNGGPRI